MELRSLMTTRYGWISCTETSALSVSGRNPTRIYMKEKSSGKIDLLEIHEEVQRNVTHNKETVKTRNTNSIRIKTSNSYSLH